MGKQLLAMPEHAVIPPIELPPIDLAREFSDQVIYWQNKEPVISAFWEAVDEACQAGPIAKEVEEVVTIHSRKNPDATAPFIAGVIRTAFRAYLEESDPNFDIQSLTTKESWRQPLGRIALALTEGLEDVDNIAAQNLSGNLWIRQPQTNIARRYSAPELLLQLTRERFPGGVNALDVGSGIMLGPLAMMDQEARKLLRFRQATDPTRPDTPDERQLLTEKTNRLLSGPSILNGYVCNDIHQVYREKKQAYDGGAIAWSKASRRPSEANDPLIDSLTGSKNSSTRFHRARLNDSQEFTKFKDYLEGETFDFISCSTVMHQMRPEQREAIFDNLLTILTPRMGLIYVADFAILKAQKTKQPQAIPALEMAEEWHIPESFRGFIYDNAMPKRRRGLEQAFSFNDSRCHELTYGTANLKIKDKILQVADAVRLASLTA